MYPALVLAFAGLAACAMICATVLIVSRSWLRVHRDHIGSASAGENEIRLRIELADVRERLKKLELIASGVDI